MLRVDIHHNPTADISVIVPVLDDSTRLRALLDLIARWSPRPREMIVVSAEAETRLPAFCEDRDCRYLGSEPCRGTQQDLGARAAKGHILWFLHADATPCSSSLGEIGRAVTGGAEGGHFKFRFSGSPMLRKKAIEWLIDLRVRFGGIPYGDQGIFVRRDVYLQVRRVPPPAVVRRGSRWYAGSGPGGGSEPWQRRWGYRPDAGSGTAGCVAA